MRHFPSRPRRRAIALALAAMLSAAGLQATFTSSVSTEPQHLNTGDGQIELTAGTLLDSDTSSVANLVPGDYVTRNVTVHNGASFDFSTISLSASDSVAGAPFTSTAQGLRLTLERCDSAFSSCTVLHGPDAAPTGVIRADIGGPAKVSGAYDYLRITQRFVGPDATKALKGAQALITYTFTASQRAPITPGPSDAFGSVVYAANPVAWWRFDESAGATTVTEFKTGTPSPRKAGASTTAGVAPLTTGTAALRSNSGSGFDCLANSPMNFSGAASIEVWVQRNVGSAVRTILAERPGSTGTQAMEILVRTDGSIQARLGVTVIQTAANTVGSGTTHIAIVGTASTAVLYVNGVAISTYPFSGYLNGVTGPASFCQISGFTGTVDELVVYNKTLTASEVLAHYNAGRIN